MSSGMQRLKIDEVCQVLECSKSTFNRHFRYSSNFPLAYKIGKKVKWDRGEVEEWLTKYAPRGR